MYSIFLSALEEFSTAAIFITLVIFGTAVIFSIAAPGKLKAAPPGAVTEPPVSHGIVLEL